ncbi:MAG TPA: helix-turn-helix transcriptional regulator [Acidimicrobiia bacterium]|nr:helix-turn-helix transcriptional regulator [Acidimicrobiia bacterium]
MSESKHGGITNGDGAVARIPKDKPLPDGQPESRHADERHTEVGVFIRLQRERANLSLRRLADRAGISNPYLSQIERGVRKPSAEILKRISRALSISAETLYTRAGLIEGGSVPMPVIDAIEADPVLSPRQKQVLLDVYRTLISSVMVPETESDRTDSISTDPE